MKPRLLITRHLPDAVEARAARDYDATFSTDAAPVTADKLLEAASGHDGLLITGSDKMTAAVVERLPASVKIIATFSVGYEHIDVAACKARGIIATNTPDVLTDATADIALLLMLGASRRAYEGEQAVRTAAWKGWMPTQLLGIQVTGKRLGLYGMGRIGQATARRAKAFGMEIHYHNRRPIDPAIEKELGATYHATAESLLKVSDVLSLHAPAGPETNGFLNAERIELLPPKAIVVNTARGTLIDDDALISALKSGRLMAAGLDVFAGEPNIDPRYRSVTNSFLLPHLGSATLETRNAMGFRALDNLDRFFQGSEPGDRIA
ncbi:2-hydroxyacid dehydrogenase [Lacibacterium aquatile]|uniref:2-hydroxyacid dehydrogenase n=1 Tax=Lacibacterium aquatile TaxID=1168082 RepID=A0ABW5DTV6_9PROT